MYRTAFIVSLALCFATPARAQWVVVDPGAIAQAVLAVRQAVATYQHLQAQARNLQTIGAYRLPPLPPRPVLPRVLGATVQMLPLSEDGMGLLGPQQLAMADTDARLRAMLTQSADVAAFSQALAARLQRLEGDVTAPGQRSQAAMLDTLNASQLLVLRQNEARLRVAEAHLDLAAAQALAQRNDQATLFRMRMDVLGAAETRSGADILKTWRQPQ